MKSNAATIILLASSLAISSRCVWAQSTGAAKHSKPLTYPYSSEEAGTLSAALARKDLDLRAALTAAPESAELLYAYALVLRQEGKAHDSLAAYTRAASLRKPTAQELRSVALDYVMLNDYDDAIHWLEMAAQIDPQDAEVLYSLGRCYYSKDRYQDARKLYEQVLAIQPRNLKAEENLGLVYDATNEPDKAEEALRKATSWADAGGTDEWPFLDLGGFLLDHNHAAEAINELRIAVRIKPRRAESHEKLGRALLATHDTSGGIEELREASHLEPENPRTHYELGRALRQAGQIDKAQEEFKLSQKLYAAHSQE
jgi:Flp pilus assembly protein TadD